MVSPTESRSWRLELGKMFIFTQDICHIIYHISSYITVSHISNISILWAKVSSLISVPGTNGACWIKDGVRSCFSERWRWRYLGCHVYTAPKIKRGTVELFLFSPLFGEGKVSNLTNIFQMGWNHQLVGDLWMFLLFQRGCFEVPKKNYRGSRSKWLWECLGHLGDGRTKQILKDDKVFIPWIYLCWLPSLKLTYSMKPLVSIVSVYSVDDDIGWRWWHRRAKLAD